MQQKNLAKHILNIIVGLTPLLYLAYRWADIPVDAPLNYALDGTVNNTGTKNEFLLAIALMSVISIGVYLLLINIHKIDPKRAKEGKAIVFDRVATGCVVFISALGLVIVQQALQQDVDFFKIAVLPLIGALFMFLGNMMYNIKPNYFAGIRLPWTLSDDENWKKTHRLTGKLWFVGGLVLILTALVIDIKHTELIMNITMGIMISIPIIYSFVFFKKKQKEQSTNL